MRPFLFIMITLATVLLHHPAHSAEPAAGGRLIVATRHVPPFSIHGPDGNWHGISIALWRKVAERMGMDYEFREMGLPEMLAAVEKSEVHAAVAALTATAEREQRFDFSHPFLSSGLGIAVPHNSDLGWLKGLQSLLTGGFLRILIFLFVLLIVLGIVIWFLEHRRNPQFGGKTMEGIGSGLWWSAVTMTTVGYGDKAPVTLWGRAIALVWMFISILMLASFTAAFTTALTIGELSTKLSGPEDLARVDVVSVAETTSAAYLQSKYLTFYGAKGLDEAIDILLSGEAEALVYDAPILRYRTQHDSPRRMDVLPGSFERQDYAIALPPGSPLREPINRILLDYLKTSEWDEVLYRYLGTSR